MPKNIMSYSRKKVALMKVDNAVILAAGTSSRFAPLSVEVHKGLIEVRGEILLERQINQLKEAGISEIIVVTGYKAEQFEYLKEKYGVKLIHNPYYLTHNNNSSVYVAKNYLRNSYICSSDNYFLINPFESEIDSSYYSAVYAEGETNEWCIEENKYDGRIEKVTVGGRDSWVMLGPVFWSEEFSRSYLSILEDEYDMPGTADKLWETIYIEHIDELDMKIKKYPSNFIFEFDTLDELREFDESYKTDSRSTILKSVARQLGMDEKDIVDITSFKDKNNAAVGFTFNAGSKYRYYYKTEEIKEI